MRKIDGKYYRTFRGHSGKRYRFEMTADEVEQERIYRAVLVTMPVLMFLILAAAAGLLW